MIYLAVVFVSGFLLSFLLIKFRKWFFNTVEDTLALVNEVLSEEDDESKQRKLIHQLKKIILSLGLSIVLLVVTLVVTLAPLYIYSLSTCIPQEALDTSSYRFWVCFAVATIIPFFIFKTKKVEDYTEASILFHKLILNNYNLGKKLFGIDTFFKKNKKVVPNEFFVIVSGLARAGTTALTEQLFKVGTFSSLSYANMPLLMAPNLWKKLYKPKTSNLKERKHGDKVLFGLNTIEALEEYFFKVQLNDSFIAKEYLLEHTINEKVYNDYIKYQTLIRESNEHVYLSKNNNIILRYSSLRGQNKKFKVIFIFREPLAHADSLLNQHNRFSKFQTDSPFIETYMNWLCHHEFGKGQKVFKFGENEFKSEYPKENINYWLQIWINYYSHLLKLDLSDVILLEYEDYLKKPKEVVQTFSQLFNMPFEVEGIKEFNNQRAVENLSCNPQILTEANNIYKALCKQKLKF